MSARSENVRVGVFVLAGVALIVIMVVVLGAGAFLRSTVPIETYMAESVQGLDVGSPVKQLGVQIGRVSAIGFVRTEYKVEENNPHFISTSRLVLIKMELDAKIFQGRDRDSIDSLIAELVERGLRIKLAPQGLTGQAYLEMNITDPKQNPPMQIFWDPHTLYIPSSPSTIAQLTDAAQHIINNIADIDAGKLVNQAIALLEDLRVTNANLQQLLNGQDLGQIRTDLAASAHNVRRITDMGADQTKILLDHVASIATKLDTAATALERATRNDSVSHVVSDAEAAAKQLRQASAGLPGTLDDLRQTVRTLNAMVANNQGDINSLVANLDEISRNLRELTESAKDYPSQILLGNPPPHFNGAPLSPAAKSTKSP